MVSYLSTLPALVVSFSSKALKGTTPVPCPWEAIEAAGWALSPPKGLEPDKDPKGEAAGWFEVAAGAPKGEEAAD